MSGHAGNKPSCRIIPCELTFWVRPILERLHATEHAELRLRRCFATDGYTVDIDSCQASNELYKTAKQPSRRFSELSKDPHCSWGIQYDPI
jgi:hypothetical protein